MFKKLLILLVAVGCIGLVSCNKPAEKPAVAETVRAKITQMVGVVNIYEEDKPSKTKASLGMILSEGDVVEYNDVAYIATQDTTNAEPDSGNVETECSVLF